MAEKNDTRAHVWISGRVQGVMFRGSTEDIALSLGLTGWVRNCPDGRVEAVFEGPQSQVRRAVQWCHGGPRSARVDNVDVVWETATGEFNNFRITY